MVIWASIPHLTNMDHVLANLRQQIDALDGDLITLLAKRQQLVGQVLIIKKQHKLPGRIQTRVEEVIENAAARAVKIGMNPDLARTIWAAMVEWFVLHEEKELAKR
jgi:isochorismate pyruvate lyase